MARWISWLTLALFLVSLFSGLVVMFAYHPSAAYESVQKLTYLIPYGAFFRQLHYFSSELLMGFLIAHITMELLKKSITMRPSAWVYGVVGALAVVLLMFSGFVLKADQSANAATQVTFTLMGDTPLLSNLQPLIQDTISFYHKFFIWHIVLLPLLLGYGIYRHIKLLLPQTPYIIIATALSVLTLLLIAMPADIIPNEAVEHLQGPWFFWGAENLLQMELGSWMVTLIMTIPFVLLVLIIFASRRTLLKFALILWIVFYTIVSLAWWL